MPRDRLRLGRTEAEKPGCGKIGLSVQEVASEPGKTPALSGGQWIHGFAGKRG